MTVRTAILIVVLVGCGKRNFNEADLDAPVVTCPANYTAVAGAGNLKYGPRPTSNKTWVSAHMSCLNEGTHLATPTSRYEALALRDLASVSALWVGVSTIDAGNVWTTVYDVPATYLPWNLEGSEPDGNGECVMMDIAGEFNDRACGDLAASICECRGL